MVKCISYDQNLETRLTKKLTYLRCCLARILLHAFEAREHELQVQRRMKGSLGKYRIEKAEARAFG